MSCCRCWCQAALEWSRASTRHSKLRGSIQSSHWERTKMKLHSIIPTETISIALDTIRAHKLRSSLTVLGIVVGVVVVVAIASILTGLRGRIIEMIEEYGT